MTRVAILVHPDDPIDHAPYFITAFAEYWRRAGVEVEIVRGPDHFVPADIAILHVDLTRVPASYLRLMARYPRTINLATADISKRRFSDRIVRWPGDHDGPVMVKTDRNHGGVMERNKMIRGLPWVIRRIGDQLPWWLSGRFRGSKYPIYESTRQVPPLAWIHPRLLVERLETERVGTGYCVRRWLFFGSREVNYCNIGSGPHVTRETKQARQLLGPPPDELRAMRQRLGFDFGKFDYALIDGRVALFDINRTPNLRSSRESFFAPRNGDLASGLWDFLPSRGSAAPVDAPAANPIARCD